MTSKPALTLYHWPQSYFSAIARFALLEAGLSYSSIPVSLTHGDNAKPEYMSLNPKGTIPTLVIQDTEDGNEKKVLTESRDILDYAVSKRPELNGGDREEADAFIEKCYTGSLNYLYIVGVSSHLLQRNAMLAKWKSRYEDAKNKMEATGENAELKKAYEEKARVNKEKVDTFPGLGPPWGEEKGEEVVGELEKILGDKKYLGGDEFTKMDVCAGVVLFYYSNTLGFEGKIWGPEKHKTITDYFERLKSRPTWIPAMKPSL